MFKKQAYLRDPSLSDSVVLMQELRQAKVRLTLGFVVVIAFFFVAFSFSKYKNVVDSGEFYKMVAGTVVLFWGMYQILLFKFNKNVKPSTGRILTGQIIDSIMTAYVMTVGNVGTMFFAVYLWIILGNGMRFGQRLLISCQIFSLTAFSISVVLTPFWHQHIELAISFIVTLVLVPSYFGVLVNSLAKIRDELVKKEKAQVDLLKQMDNMKTTFFANISHEFRTPIALTLGSLDMIERDAQDTAKQIPIVRRNQNRLLQLINQILDLEKMEQGGLDLKFSPLANLDQFLIRRAEQFQAMAVKKSLKLNVNVQTNLKAGDIYVDPDNLDKVIFNLLSNAFKFTAKGEVTLSANVENDKLIIDVSDSGMGIKEDQLHLIFDRFRQATGSVSKDYAGTGIGLSLVQEIVKLHGGEIKVNSEYGKGTTFSVSLRLGKSHLTENQINPNIFSEDDSVKQQAETVNEGLSDTAGIEEHKKWNEKYLLGFDPKKKIILYVDDNYDLRNYLINLLSDSYNLLLAWDGVAALEILEIHTPDLILSDLMMPKLDGAGLIKNIRLNPDLQEIPFVILTAKAMESTKFDLLDAGADDFLFKPFSRDELLVRVRNLLSLREKTTLARRELLEAKKIQRSLLAPENIEFDQMAVGVLYKSCDTLSGDFYDVLKNEDHILCYVADVTSHGTSAAQITYLIKSTLKSLFEENPAATVSHILKQFAKRYTDYKLDYGIGIQIFKFDTKNQNLTYTNSNSPIALLKHKEGYTALDMDANPLIDAKFFKEETDMFIEHKINFKLGDSVVFFTDGCVELTPKNGQVYDDRQFNRDLQKVLDSKEWRSQILQKLVDHQGSDSFPDDITIMRLTAK